MQRHKNILITGLAITLASAGALSAQTPIGLLHGLASGPGTWHDAAVYLKANLTVDTIVPAFSWSEYYEDQESDLSTTFGSSAIVVGHSNGGVVARYLAQQQTLAGVLTWGSPNVGAPLADNFSDVVWYLGLILDESTESIVSLASYSLGTDALDALGPAIDAAYETVFGGVAGLSEYLGYEVAPVLAEMGPDAYFMTTTLNSGAAHATELSNVGGNEAAASFVASDYYYGGLVRALDPGDADAAAAAIYSLAAAADGWAVDLIDNADPYDCDPDDTDALWDAFDALEDLSIDLSGLDAEWCADVTGVYPYSPEDCPENDEIVPVWSQKAGPGVQLDPQLGPVHTQETGQSSYLAFVLTNTFGVP